MFTVVCFGGMMYRFIEIAEFEMIAVESIAHTCPDGPNGEAQVVLLKGGGALHLRGARRDEFRKLWIMPGSKIFNRSKSAGDD
jgi:hypothetical protein